MCIFVTEILKTDFMKRLYIFDLDGTVLDTIADLAASANYALAEFGYPGHPVEAYRFFVGNGISKLIERALPEGHRSKEDVAKVRERFIPYYNIHNADFSRPYEGVTEVMEELQRRGCMIAVASNKYQEATEKLIPHYFPTIKFVSILGQREGVPSKPDPIIVYEIMEAAGVSRSEVVYIGDSSVDMQTGTNAGVTTIGVSWGFRPKSELMAYNPKRIVDKPEEILEC